MVRPKRAASNAKKLKSTTESESAVAPAASEETLTEPHTNDTRSKEDDQAASPTVRKRRLASLNAEFLVHYCSTSNNHNNNNNGNDATNNNNNHSGNGHAQPHNNSTGSGGANKRRRTISSRATTTNDDESSNKPKRRSPPGAKKVAKEAEEKEEEAVEPVKRKTSLRGKRKPKKQEEESDEEKSEDESSEKEETGKGRGRRNGRNVASNQSKKAKEPPAVVESLISTRPRREAGLRASAMIIQTNEIEKSNRAFQFIHSTANTAHHGSNGAEKKLKHSPKTEQPVNKKHTTNTTANNTNNTHTFQVPQAVSVFAASQQRQQAASLDQDIKPVISNTSNIMSHVNLLSKKKQLSATYASQNNQSSNNLSSANTFPLRQISTCTTMGSLSALAPTPGATVGNIDNDSSSNEVQIVAEKCGSTLLNGIKTPPVKLVKTDLTEANLAEHNRLNGTTSGTNGAGTFNNHTKEYISRWAAEHAKYLSMTEEPFKADEVVPLESFGEKILNNPQYKLKQGNGHNNSSHDVIEKNVVASSTGKTNLTKLSGVVVGGGAGASGGIKQDPHMKLNGNSKELIKPTTNHANHNTIKKTRVKKCAVN